MEENNDNQDTNNTGALEILHTINENSKKYYKMWLYTFITCVCETIFIIIYMLNK